MEYTVLTCWYRLVDQPEPGNGPYSKLVTKLLTSGWRFKGELKSTTHIISSDRIYVLFIQEFTRGEVE